ncbi:MAG: hypothetical protein AAB319_11015 [Pseudomonadota bacterium]
MSEDFAARRDFPGRGMFINLLRAAHLFGVVGIGHLLLTGLPLAEAHGYAFLLVGAGLGIMALDRWSHPDYFRQVNGLAVLAKLVLVLALAYAVAFGVEAFWGLLIVSVLLAHAPGWLRHRKLF